MIAPPHHRITISLPMSPFLATGTRTRAPTRSHNLNLIPLQPNHGHLIQSIRRKLLNAISSPRKPIFVRAELSPRILEVVGLDKGIVLGKNGVKVSRYKTTSSRAKIRSCYRKLSRPFRRLDWERVQMHVDEPHAGEGLNSR